MKNQKRPLDGNPVRQMGGDYITGENISVPLIHFVRGTFSLEILYKFTVSVTIDVFSLKFGKISRISSVFARFQRILLEIRKIQTISVRFHHYRNISL